MLLNARNIHKSYGTLHVLKGINIEVSRGEIISIVGSSGAGKSTLMHIMGTLDSPDRGELFYEDRQVNTLSLRDLARFRNKHIGFVFQFHHLLPEFTALENVCIPAFIAGTKRVEAEATARKILSLLGLTERLDHKPDQMSGGEQQRVAVARALINKPDIVMADEPSGNLDSENAQELHRLFFDLRKEFNQTFIIVTHNEELADMADRKLVMRDGLFI